MDQEKYWLKLLGEVARARDNDQCGSREYETGPAHINEQFLGTRDFQGQNQIERGGLTTCIVPGETFSNNPVSVGIYPPSSPLSDIAPYEPFFSRNDENEQERFSQSMKKTGDEAACQITFSTDPYSPSASSNVLKDSSRILQAWNALSDRNTILTSNRKNFGLLDEFVMVEEHASTYTDDNNIKLHKNSTGDVKIEHSTIDKRHEDSDVIDFRVHEESIYTNQTQTLSAGVKPVVTSMNDTTQSNSLHSVPATIANKIINDAAHGGHVVLAHINKAGCKAAKSVMESSLATTAYGCASETLLFAADRTKMFTEV